MEHSVSPILPLLLFLFCVIGLALGLLIVANVFNPGRPGRVQRMPYESGMDPIHDTRRRFDVRFHLLAIAFLIFDVELMFLYPWAVASRPAAVAARGEGRGTRDEGRGARGEGRGARGEGRGMGTSVPIEADFPRPSPLAPRPSPNRHLAFAGAMTFVALLTLGFVYDWRKGIFQWR